MIKIEINNLEFYVKPNISVLEACKYIGINVPRFCYHETLSVAGNCRMCLVELQNSPKPVASCAMPVANNMKIFVNTPLVKKARESVLESLLLNHPLDCPICDQGGECDLQDQTKQFGGDHSRFFFNKRGVEDKYCGPIIKTIMTRCIHCTRCVRFGMEISGSEYLGTLNRGGSTEIGGYLAFSFNSEISGNVIDLCPVGALTSKPYAFKTRPWELRSVESLDVTDGVGANIFVNFKETEIARIQPKINSEINDTLISDKARFYFDSNKTQRIYKLFEKSKETSKFLETKWPKIINSIDSALKNNKSTLILVNDDLDFVSVHLAQQLAYQLKGKLSVKSISSRQKNSNLYVSSLKNKILDLKTKSKVCFLFCSNIKIEAALLNTKLRLKYLYEDLTVLGVSQVSSSNFPIRFVNLNFKYILSLLEGKNKLLSRLLLSSSNPIIFFGESLLHRGFSADQFLFQLKKINETTIFLNIQKRANSETLSFLNISTVNKKDFLFADTIIAINLDSTCFLSKYLSQLNNLIWLNTHGSTLSLKSDLIIPTQTEFEGEKIFINLEDRIQKTNKSVSSVGSIRSTSQLLESFLNNYNRIYELFVFKFEVLNKPQLFSKIQAVLSDVSLLENKFLKDKRSIKLFPAKNSFEDFYRTSLSTKNSSTMLKCSKEVRKFKTNF